MNLLRRMFATVLILSVLGLHFPEITLAGPGRLLAKAVTAPGITEHPPEILALPEEEIPARKVKKKKSRTWLWVLGGALLVGGAIAAIACGGGDSGGDDSGGDDDDNEGDTGDITVRW